MTGFTKLISLVALLATVLPSLGYFFGWIDHGTVKTTALVATIGWFCTTPLWLGRDADA